MSDPLPSSSPPTVLLGICGGIAAYKAVDVASRLRKAGFSVHVAMSEAAREFVTPLTFGAISGNPVLDRLFPKNAAGDDAYPHLYPATRATAFVLVPATANTIARMASGEGSDLLSTCALSLPPDCTRMFCPAMNVEMWGQPVVQANAKTLEARGWIRVGPEAGVLACGMEGEGRMAEPPHIVARLQEALAERTRLAGRRVLVLSGPTREHMDPVRFIGNPSSGKMGKAIAEAATRCGADVQFITGPVPGENLPRHPGIRVRTITSADDLLAAARACYAEADLIIYAAAVADYRPKQVHAEKLPKQPGSMTIELEATPDVAATLNAGKRPGQVAIGFALQTHDGPARAAEKMARKQFDGIVLNALDALGGDRGTYTWLEPGATGPENWGALSKNDCARRILERAIALLASR